VSGIDGDDQRVGLCAACRHCQIVQARSRFYLCRRSFEDRRFDRYPRLPVVTCPGFEPGPVQAGPAAVS
jgi:hypothetical protein